MTMPDERTRAVEQVKEFLYDLINSRKTKRVPSEIRQRASDLLKHYPGQFDLLIAYQQAANVWGPPNSVRRVPKSKRRKK